MNILLTNLFFMACTDVDSASIEQYKPKVISFDIQPESGIVIGDLLLCEAEFEDVEGVSLRPNYRWTNLNTDEVLGEEPQLLWEGDFGSPNDQIECQANAKDKRSRSIEISGSIPVLNSPPIIEGIAIEPTQAFNDTLLGCAATATDPDGGTTIELEYQWVNQTQATQLGTGSSINLHPDLAEPEDNIACLVTAIDADGGKTESDYVTQIVNREPAAPTVVISPPNPSVLDTLNCEAIGAEDPDRDAITLAYLWFIDGESSSSNGTVFQDVAIPGQEVMCQITVDDGRGETVGIPGQASVIIQNSPPTAPTWVEVTPDPPSDNDDLICTATGSEDPEGLDITLHYTWIRNGLVWQGIPLDDGSRVPASATEENDSWQCIVEAFDGYDFSTAVNSNTVVVGFSCFYGDCDDAISLGIGLGIDMITIFGDQFSMGSAISELDRDTDELLHLVTLTDDRLISTTEITQDAFEAVMGYLPPGNNGCGECPVVNLTWNNAAAFANFLSLAEGYGQCYACSFSNGLSCEFSQNYPNVQDCLGYRLPTESEWEFAMRAGSTGHFWTPNGGANYASGSESICDPIDLGNGFYLSDAVHWCENATGLQPVATLLPNSWGLFDMVGNAEEWVHDRYGLYPLGQSIDPNGGVGGNMGILRGGCFADVPSSLRAANRTPAILGQQQSNAGFRIARSLP